MAYINRVQKDRAAELIAELVDLASFKDIGASALTASALCSLLGIDTDSVMAHLPDELTSDRDFTL